MKKLSLLLALLLVLGAATVAFAGIVDGKKFELSTALSFESISFHYPGEPAGFEDTISFINLPIRFGWFIWQGLEFEPELMLTRYHSHYVDPGNYDEKYSETGWVLSGNLLYNFKLKNSPFVPFVLAGFGFGNGIPFAGYTERYDPGAKSSTPNLGVGVRYLFGHIGALRLEYRYRHFRINDPYEGEIDHVTMNSVFVGMSLFF